MNISSPDFGSGNLIPKKYSCQGSNTNPTLTIQNIPKTAKSLVLVVDDPDAPGGTFTHWLVWNIDPSVTEIKENSVPAGAVQGQNGAGQNHYVGPCPPSGTHRYFFKVYALDTMLELPKTATIDDLSPLLAHDRLDNGQLMGLYQKQ